MKPYIISLLLLCSMALFSCKPKSGNSDAANNGTTSEYKPNIIRKQLHVVDGFDHITSTCSADIIFSFGDYSIEAEGDSALINCLHLDYDCNLLTVKLGMEGNPDLNLRPKPGRVRLYISAPSLQCVSLCNVGGFQCTDRWQGDNLQVAIYADAKITLGEVECNKIVIESTYNADLNIAHLKADVATLASRVGGTYNIDCEVKDLGVLNMGMQSIHLTGRVGQKTISKPNDPNLKDETIMSNFEMKNEE